MGTNYTLDKISSAVNANSVPGVPGTHVSGSTYRVSAAFGISPGHVQFLASADGRYDGKPTTATAGDHEWQHTHQWRQGSFPFTYMWDLLTKGQKSTRWEKEADDAAEAGC